MKLTPNIEKNIKSSGLRKDFIANKLNVSVRQLRKYETGESLIPIDKAYVLARLLNKKVDDLYDFEGEDK
ncbi:helix-turn-helix transcriptional regulator [Margalitia sp. FSL K6-0131]|uniref:helix-turn-helix transcriptional regulator n=1 Tax=Margalitia sp. FSL K6-0131 TaxID=2954604 RepID=UPI0030F925FF